MAITKLSISTDSTADLSPELYKEFDITPIPLGVIIGEKAHLDGVDITPDMIYDAVENQKIMPKTSACSELDYTKFFEEGLAKSGVHIHIAISDKFSVTYANAVRASQNLKNVFVVNSLSLSAGTGMVAIIARELANSGKSIKEIIEQCDYYAQNSHVSFVLSSLKYLHKGGRCSGLKMLGANLLGLHPQIVVTEEGSMSQGKIFQGKFPAVVKKYTQYIIEKFPNADKDSIAFVTHTDVEPAIQKQVEDDLRSAGFKRIYNTTAGCVITCHCGRSTIGILLHDK